MPKQENKGGEPAGKSGVGQGRDGQSLCPNDAAMSILRSAADLCGLLVVAVVSPLGGRGGPPCSSAGSPQRLALSEVRRKAELREREGQILADASAPAPRP